MNKKRQSYSYRISFYKELRNKNILFDPLDFEKYLDDIKIRNKNNANIIIYGKLNPIYNLHSTKLNKNIIIKMTFKNNYNDNSLEVENDIYEKVISKLILNKNTPNVIMYIGTYKYKNYIKYLSQYKNKSKIYNKLLNKINKINNIYNIDNNIYNINDVNLLIIEQGEQSLYSLFKTIRNKYHIFTIIYQIVYTLKCFEEIGLMHHDLHHKNILIDTIDCTKYKYYDNINNHNKYKILNIKYLIKIFDFDHSCKDKTSVSNNLTSFIGSTSPKEMLEVKSNINNIIIYNNMLDLEYYYDDYNNNNNEKYALSNRYNMNNKFKKGYDFFRIMNLFYHDENIPIYVNEWIEKQIPITLFEQTIKNNMYGLFNLKDEKGNFIELSINSLDYILETQFSIFNNNNDYDDYDDEYTYKLPSII